MSGPVLDSPTLVIFVRLAEQAGCRVVNCGDSDLEDAGWWERLLVGVESGGDALAADASLAQIAIAQSVVDLSPSAARVLRVRGAVQTDDPMVLASCTVGVNACPAAVAETGSLLLAGAEPGDRLVWLLPPRCVLLVRTADVLPSLDDAMTWLQRHRTVGAATLVTGPSRTSDVERVLTIGVQGPREVVVVVVEERTD